MTKENPQMDVELVKWLDANKKKVVFKAVNDGMEFYVDDKEKKNGN